MPSQGSIHTNGAPSGFDQMPKYLNSSKVTHTDLLDFVLFKVMDLDAVSSTIRASLINKSFVSEIVFHDLRRVVFLLK